MKTEQIPDWHLHAVAALEAENAALRADRPDYKRMAEDNNKIAHAAFQLLADIRAAAGDPEGKLIQDELVEHIAQLFGNSERLAAVEAEIAALREQLNEWLSANGPNGWIDALREDKARLFSALYTLTAVVGLTPITGNKEALQEAVDIACKAIDAAKGGAR